MESFNGRLRDECLNEHLFSSYSHARGIIERWTIAAITGHRTAEMVRKYTDKHRRATLAISKLDAARGHDEND